MLYSVEVRRAPEGGDTTVRQPVRRVRTTCSGGVRSGASGRTQSRCRLASSRQCARRRRWAAPPRRRCPPTRRRRCRLITHPLVRPAPGHRPQGAVCAVSGSSYGIASACRRTKRSTLLDELAAHATQRSTSPRLSYRVGDLVIWDNASLLHSATLTRSRRSAHAVADHAVKSPRLRSMRWRVLAQPPSRGARCDLAREEAERRIPGARRLRASTVRRICSRIASC